MFSTFVTTALLFLLAVTGAHAVFTIDTPLLVQCQNATTTWSGGSTSPFNLIVVDAAAPCDNLVASLGDFTGSSATWLVNVVAGTQVMFNLEDAIGDEAWSGTMTVQGSNDSSCLTSSSSVFAHSSTTSSSSHTKPTNSQSVAGGVANAGHSPSGALPARQLSGATAFIITAVAVIAGTFL